MAALERHRGHFYNWYDTESLKPLLPMYVSSVDSGNLAASLLTLRAGLLALPDGRLLGARLFDGLGDTLMVLSETVGAVKPADLARLEKDLESARAFPTDGSLWVLREHLALGRLCRADLVLSKLPPETTSCGGRSAFAEQCRADLEELTFLAPWTKSAPPAKVFEDSPYFKDHPDITPIRPP